MSIHRFYIPDSLDIDAVELTGQQAHHLIHVLRGQIGQQVELFDGRGASATAEIKSLSKRTAGLRVLESSRAVDRSEDSLVLVTAVPKGDRFRWLVEKATELGVSRLIPLRAEHSVVHPSTSKLERMRQTVIEACKQCGRSQLMRIGLPSGWTQVVSQEFPNRAVFVADPSGTPLTVPIIEATLNSEVLLVIGPEGGFTGGELTQAAEAGARLINLGPRLLRVETAAIALVSLCGIASNR